MKKLLLCFLLVMTLLLPINKIHALTESVNSRITNQKTPVDSSQVTEIQELKVGYGQDPVLYGDYLYAIETWPCKLKKINKNTMEVISTADIVASAGGFTPFLEAGDGQIFVPLSDGRIQAFDAETLKSTWVSDYPTYRNAVTSKLLYHDGYLYYGTESSNDGKSSFHCISTKDEDTTQTLETKSFTWYHESNMGYYWSGAVIVNDCIAIAGDEGKVILHDLKSDKVYDTIDLGIGAITNSLFYDRESSKIIVASKSGYVVTIDVDNHELNTIKKSEKQGILSSSPLCFNGRIYVAGSGTFDSGTKAPFTVFDLDTLEVIYTIDDIKGIATPILSTAYANEENHQEIQLYMINYDAQNNQRSLYHITDNEINTEPNYQSLYITDSKTWGWNGSLIMDDQAFYAYNGNGNIVKFGFDTSKETIKDEQVLMSQLNKDIANLPSKDNVSVKLSSDLKRMMETYSRLSKEYKDQVKNIEFVKELQEIINQQNEIINQINDDIANKLNIYYINQKDEELVNNLISQYQKVHKDNRVLVEGYDEVEKAKKIIDQLKNDIIPSEVFENIKGEDINYTVEGQYQDQLKYSFTFNGMNIENTNPFSIVVNRTSKVDEQIFNYTKNAFVLDFMFEGDFPGKVKFETETTLLDGNYVLYYFNEKEKNVEYIQDIIVKDGKTSMELTHASTYFISKKINFSTNDGSSQENDDNYVSNNDNLGNTSSQNSNSQNTNPQSAGVVETGDLQSIIIPLFGFVISVVGAVLLNKKLD